MTQSDREELLGLLLRGNYQQFWYTRNYKIRSWDGTEYWTRLSCPHRHSPGIAMTEGDLVRIEWPMELGLPMYVEERRQYWTEDAGHFVDSIVSYC